MCFGPGDQRAGVAAGRLGLVPFGGERACQTAVAAAQSGFHQGEVEQVALGVAAAETVGDRDHRLQQRRAPGKVAIGECLERERRWTADVARPLD